jgi:hypothetical protein
MGRGRRVTLGELIQFWREHNKDSFFYVQYDVIPNQIYFKFLAVYTGSLPGAFPSILCCYNHRNMDVAKTQE